MGMGEGHTRLDHVRKLLADGQQQELLPRLLALVLGHPECPRTALHVPRVLPDGLDAPLEKVHRVLHLQRGQGKAVVRFPEGLERDDILEEHGLPVLVRGVVAVLVMVEGPGVLESWWPHAAEHVHLCGIALGGGGGAGWWAAVGGEGGGRGFGASGGLLRVGHFVFFHGRETIY